MTFQIDSGATPDHANPLWKTLNGCSLGSSDTIPGFLELDSRDPETETGSLETEKGYIEYMVY